MKRSLLAAALTLAPAAAYAEGPSLSFGLAVVSEYVAGGLKQSDGPAFQPWAELGFNGFYLGVWASNVDGDLANTAPDEWEYDIYAGYRGEFSGVSYDIGYFRYYYDDAGDCCGEFIGSLGYSVTDSLSMTTVVFFDPETEGAALQQKFSYALANGFSISGDIKGRNNGGRLSGTLGVGKSLGPVAVDVRYHDSDVSEPVYTLGLSWSTSIGG